MDGNLAFVCAMAMELAPITRKLALQEEEIEGLPVRSGRLGSRPVVGIVTGMGTRLAAAGTTRLLATTKVEHVVVVGITGAVTAATPVGALIVPEAVVDARTGAEYKPAELGLGTPQGKLLTGDDLVTETEAIRMLQADGVIALDMETAAIAEVCEERHVPWSVVRVVSDIAGEGLDAEVFSVTADDGTPKAGPALRYMLKHPGSIPAMLRLARGAKQAAQAAADKAIEVCMAL
jgi:nucleoside phosphorylase